MSTQITTPPSLVIRNPIFYQESGFSYFNKKILFGPDSQFFFLKWSWPWPWPWPRPWPWPWMAMAMAVAVIRPEHAGSGRADLHENRCFIERLVFINIFIISGPSRPQKWIRLEILRWKMVSGGLET